MSHVPQYEPNGERLLLVSIETPRTYSDHRHIRASVVRRCVADVLNADGSIQIYNDGSDQGYIYSHWSDSTPTGLFVDEMLIRGQMDYNRPLPQRLNNGYPYANEVRFMCHGIKHEQAKRIWHTFQQLEARTKRNIAKGRLDADAANNNDNFYCQLHRLASNLKIDRFIVPAKGWYAQDLHDPTNFTEHTLTSINDEVERMINTVRNS